MPIEELMAMYGKKTGESSSATVETEKVDEKEKEDEMETESEEKKEPEEEPEPETKANEVTEAENTESGIFVIYWLIRNVPK